jgi:prenyltransferase beta subunit
MLQVARLAPRVLGDASELVTGFLGGELEGGGFKDRSGKSDLYYTVFGLEGLLALRAEFPAAAVASYLSSFGDGASLDFVHLASLARAWSDLPPALSEGLQCENLLARLESYRTPDGGYHPVPGAVHGTVFGSFLALGAYQDLGGEVPQERRILDSLNGLRAADGGYANQPGAAVGSTPAAAAAVGLLRHLNTAAPPGLGDWLLSRAYPAGGFFASPSAPVPDLLSTATALHALAGLQVSTEGLKEASLDFIDSLWTNRGGFYGNWTEPAPDCEYTFYGLLALGHLSL